MPAGHCCPGLGVGPLWGSHVTASILPVCSEPVLGECWLWLTCEVTQSHQEVEQPGAGVGSHSRCQSWECWWLLGNVCGVGTQWGSMEEAAGHRGLGRAILTM